MALDFPASPTNGQAYGSYVYNSTVGAWQSKEDPATVATVSTTAPATGNPGDIWYDSDDGTTYMYYNDGTSAQWVELLSSGLPLLSTKANLSGGNTFTSTQSITSTAITQTPLVVNGFASQTADLQQWNDNLGTILSRISNNGTGYFKGVQTGSLSFSGITWNGISNPSGATTLPSLIVKGIASQTADLQQWQNSSGTVLSKIDSNGSINSPTGSVLGSNFNFMLPKTTTFTPLIVQGLASQTADLQQWQNSAGTVLSYVTSGGSFVSRGITSKTSSGLSVFSVGDDSSGQLELGRTDGTAANPYIDFHSGATATDFDSRIQGTGGNGTSGNGSINITATSVNFSGRITISNQPRFQAYGASGTSGTSGQDWIFPSTYVNVGSFYNTSNGRFTAPIAGTYVFFWSNIGNTQNTVYRYRLRKNGANIDDLHLRLENGTTAYKDNGAMKAMIDLAAGDYIGIFFQSDNSTASYTTGQYPWFGGYLLG